MNTPQFGYNQYFDQISLTNAFTAITSGLYTQGQSRLIQPGWLNPDRIAISSSGLVMTLTFDPAVGLINPSGVFCSPIGTAVGSSGRTYTIDFTSLVPSSGSTFFFVTAAPYSLQQNPIPVPGPPIGHPNYNPNFVPYIQYGLLVDSLNVAAQTTAPDSISTFAIGQFTLSAGATGLPALDVGTQQRASFNQSLPVQPIAFSSTLTSGNIGKLNSVVGGGTTQTLPPAAQFTGCTIGVYSDVSSYNFVGSQGSDLILGAYYIPGGSGTNQVNLRNYQNGFFHSDGTNWTIIGGNLQTSISASTGMPSVTGLPSAGIVPPSFALDSSNSVLWYANSSGWTPAIQIYSSSGAPSYPGRAASGIVPPPLNFDSATNTFWAYLGAAWAPLGRTLSYASGNPNTVVSATAQTTQIAPTILYDSGNNALWYGVSGTAWNPVTPAVGGTFAVGPNSGSNFVVPSGVFKITIESWGGGGGGGGSQGDSTNQGGGAGGGGGCYTKNSHNVLPGQVISYSIGGGGTGGLSDGTASTAGGDTSYTIDGVTYTAGGGGGGGFGTATAPSTVYGPGGAPKNTAPQIYVNGFNGGTVIGSDSTYNSAIIQAQGGSTFGFGSSLVNLGNNGEPAQQFANGGNGALYYGNGGAGAPGRIHFSW